MQFFSTILLKNIFLYRFLTAKKCSIFDFFNDSHFLGRKS